MTSEWSPTLPSPFFPSLSGGTPGGSTTPRCRQRLGSRGGLRPSSGISGTYAPASRGRRRRARMRVPFRPPPSPRLVLGSVIILHLYHPHSLVVFVLCSLFSPSLELASSSRHDNELTASHVVKLRTPGCLGRILQGRLGPSWLCGRDTTGRWSSGTAQRSVEWRSPFGRYHGISRLSVGAANHEGSHYETRMPPSAGI